MPSSTLRVAYLSSHDPRVVGGWSGLPYHIGRAVRQQPGIEVTLVGPLREWLLPAVRARQAWHRYVRGLRHRREHDPLTLAAFGWDATRNVARVAPDVVLSPGYHNVARLRTGIPIVTYTDATFANAVGRYPEFSDLSPASVAHGTALGRWAARHVAVLCFSAPYAAQSAIEDYGADPARVRTIPFGANFDVPPTAADAEAALAAREHARHAGEAVRFLFLGVDWERKGGPLAVEVVRGLRARGVDAVLDVAGCAPVMPGGPEPWVLAHGFVSKATAEGEQRLQRLLAASHFLLLPTQAEAFGVVFCEANSLAVPNLTRRVDGVPIWDGENGYAFPATAGPEPYVDAVMRLLETPGAYASLARSSREIYDRRLNWGVAGAALVAALHAAVAMGPPRA